MLLSLLLMGPGEAKEFDYCSYLDKIMNPSIKLISQEEDLLLFGYGGGMAYDIKSVETYSATLKPLTIKEARRKYVRGTEEFLKAINEDRKLRPYLHDFPFTHTNVQFRIAYHGDNPSHESYPYVRFMFEAKGKLVYDSIDPSTGEFVMIHSETYEEAVDIVQAQQRQ